MSSPLVSIIIPAFNAEAWIDDSIASGLAQSWPSVELIVVDDGSVDGTAERAGTYQSRGVRVITQPNRGASAARNRGLSLACGAYVQFLDADDLLAPDKVERQMERLLPAGPRTLSAGTWGRFCEDPTEANFVNSGLAEDLRPADWLRMVLEGNRMVHPAAWLASRQLLDAAGPWDESLSLNDDGEYFARVIGRADQILFCPAAVSYYRSGLDGSLSRARGPIAWASACEATESMCRQLIKLDAGPAARTACAVALRRFELDVLPYSKALSERARGEAAGYAMVPPQPSGGPRFRVLARIVGLRLARRIQARVRDWGYGGCTRPRQLHVRRGSTP